MSNDQPTLEKSGRVATLTLTHPPANTFTEAGLLALDARLREVEADPNIAALVVTGDGDKFFCAGDDLNMFAEADPARARELAYVLTAALHRLERFHGVTIAAINGYCLGGGLECALACDIRIAETQAQLGLPETKIGLLPGGGGTQRLPWLVGEGWAKRLILCGEQIDAETAQRIGLIEQVVEPGKALDTALALAEKAGQQGPRAVAASKRLIDTAQHGALEVGHARERDVFAGLFETDEPHEGVGAFLQKRTPNWNT